MIKIDFKTKNRDTVNIECDNNTVYENIRNSYRVPNVQKKIMERRNPKAARYIPDFNFAITPGGRFDIGMIGHILATIQQVAPVEYPKVIISNEVLAHYRPKMPDFNIVTEFGDYVLRDYQIASIEAAKKKGRGIFLLGTGAGKSLIIAAFIQSMLNCGKFKKILLTVPNLGLKNQMASDFEEYGVQFTHTKWSGEDEPDFNASVIIATDDILNHQTDRWDGLYDVDALISDECHTISDSSNIRKILVKIKTPHKFGFTGTLSDKIEEKWASIGFFGPAFYSKNSAELRKEEYLTEVTVMGMEIKHKKKLPKDTDYLTECTYLGASVERNKEIIDIATKLKGNVLILVNYLDHGNNLLGMAQAMNTGKDVFFVSGETDTEVREEYKKRMEDNSNCICIAMSSIFSTGINIKNLPYIILAMGGKAYIRLVQSIGRGLRKHKDKFRLIIFDIYDNMRYSSIHHRRRREIYEDEKIRFREFEAVELS